MVYESTTAPAAENRRSRLFWIGLTGLCVGTGPLLLIILAARLGLTRDPNPNPIGPGILAGITFGPSFAIFLVGLVRTRRKRRAAGAGVMSE